MPTDPVVVIGAGPAGLAAATWLRRQGAGPVLVLEREAEAGGVPRHCGHFPYGLREFRRLMRGPDYAARLVAEAQAAGVLIRAGCSVLALRPGPRLTVTSDAGVEEIAASRVLIATGARESSRAARLLGGTKPGGVLATGALQGLVYLQGMRPFRRPVILGTELVSFSAILTCRHLGIRPVAMIEPGASTTARWPTGLFPRVLGIPLHLGTELVEIEGREAVTGVVVRGPDGATRRIATDGVIVSGQFRPEAALLAGTHLARDPATGGPEVDQFGRCSDPGFFAAGNLLRPVETAGACWAEGRTVARALLQSLRGELPDAGGQRIAVGGDALKYVVPQRVAGGGGAPALPVLQLRMNRAARGSLVFSQGAAVLARQSLDSRPERRITMPLPATSGSGPLTITLEETVS